MGGSFAGKNLIIGHGYLDDNQPGLDANQPDQIVTKSGIHQQSGRDEDQVGLQLVKVGRKTQQKLPPEKNERHSGVETPV